MIERMIGAAMLRSSTYEEIEADRGALAPAIVIVILVTICGIAGEVIGDALEGSVNPIEILGAVLNGTLFGLLRWALWVTLIYLVGAQMLKTESTETSWAELGRVAGFAYTPGLLTLLSFLPFINSFLLGAIAFVWILVAVIIGIRQALDFEGTGRAILVAGITGIIGFIPWLILKVIEWVITAEPPPM